MFGTNTPVKVNKAHDGAFLPVRDLFYTIQGEGPWMGTPAVFVRLGGCTLRCWFCDTDFNLESSRMTPAATVLTLVEKARESVAVSEDFFGSPSLVVITGGEPLAYNLAPVVDKLCTAGWHVQVETSGVGPRWEALENLIGQVPLDFVVSPKTRSVSDQIGERADAWKYIIGPDDDLDPDDGLPLTSTQHYLRRERLCRPLNDAPVFVQPMDCYLADGRPDREATREAYERTAWVAMRYGYRVSLQMHKHLEVA